MNNQYHVLADDEDCHRVEKKYGKISRKCVLYRGNAKVLENGIEYMNVEDYLRGIG